MNGNFYGRKDILALIKRRVADLKEGYRQNMAVLGSQYVGKSALLRQFLSDLDDEMIVAVYLDLEGRDIDYVASKFVRSVLYRFARIKGLCPGETLQELLAAVEQFIPQTAARAGDVFALMGKNRLSEAYDALLAMPEVFSYETGLSCLIIIDEFQVLDGLGVPDAFSRLADRITTQKRSLYVLASSYEEAAKRILSEQLTLLFGNFEVVMVEPFDLHQSQEFITARMGSINIGVQLKNFLADFTGGRPLYLDIILQELINLASVYKQQEIYAPLIAQAVENMVFSRWGALSRHFELMMGRVTAGKSNRSVSDLLMLMAEGRYRVKDLQDADASMKPAAINQRLGYLVEEDVVERNGTHFHIKDKMFRYWIKYVFQKRVQSIELEPDRLKMDFKDEILRSMSDFNATSRQDLSCRVTELLQCFDNDQVRLKGRKYKMPAFRDVKPVKLVHSGGSQCDVLEAQTDEGTWLLVLHKDPLAESDINVVTQEMRSRGLKPRHCVIVSLSELEDGVRLRALEERMWIWNEPELNVLMSLFNKPYIVS
ncbi:MAG: ATP-binding protein [Candidatus Omnitrophica bacterium]|nr:ATP-binding protein [Candidatus Omnitrophota bacterium]